MDKIFALYLLFLSVKCDPLTLVLTGIARDFTPSTSPDFENVIADDRYIPQTLLDLDGKPIFNGNAVHTTVQSDTTFSQWYRNVPSVNIPIQISITLTKNSDVYTYENLAFFPIDGQGFGNYLSYGHNYHFTTEFRTTFSYKGGEHFTFTGDDDMFVFINGKLAIDLGGVHGAESETISIDSLGLTQGNTYTLDIFHAERHTVASAFRIDTTLDLSCVDPPNNYTNPGRKISICEVVYPNFCPGIALDDERCPQLPILHFPDGTTEPFSAFNAISFGDFSNSNGGDIEGRLAVRDNLHLYAGSYSVGYELRTGGPSAIDTPQRYSLVIGNDIYFPSGAIYPLGNNIPYQAAQEFGFYGGSFYAPNYLAQVLEGNCSSSGCLNNDFDQAQIYYSAVQNAFLSVSDTGATFNIDGANTLKINCNSMAVSSVSLTLTPAQLSSVFSYDTNNCNPEAQIVINVPNPSNEDVSFTGNNFNHRAEKILFNIGGNGVIKVNTKVVGSILAPHASLLQPTGVIVGLVIVANCDNSLQINRLYCHPEPVDECSEDTNPPPPSSIPSKRGSEIPNPPECPNNTLCPTFEDDCPGYAFPLGDGVYSFKDFNVISFDSFTGNNGDIEGRLAARNNILLGSDGYSIGYELFTAIGGPDNSLPYALIAGRDLIFLNGRVYPDGSGTPYPGPQEFIFAGSSFTGPDYLRNVVTGHCILNEDKRSFGSGGCLDIYFDAALACYINYSNKLAALVDNTVLTLKWDGAFIRCNDNMADTNVASFSESQLAYATWFVTENCKFQSEWIINVRGTGDVTFTGGSFPGISGGVVYNVIGSGRTITVRDTDLRGNLLSPKNTLNQPNGVINGKVVVGNITSCLQINREGQCTKDDNITIIVPCDEDSPRGSETLTLLASALRVNDVISAGGDLDSHTVVEVSGNKVVVQPPISIEYSAGTIVFTQVSSLTTRPNLNSTYVAPTPNTPNNSHAPDAGTESGASNVSAAIALLLFAFAL